MTPPKFGDGGGGGEKRMKQVNKTFSTRKLVAYRILNDNGGVKAQKQNWTGEIGLHLAHTF